jgi:hypothetical protein
MSWFTWDPDERQDAERADPSATFSDNTNSSTRPAASGASVSRADPRSPASKAVSLHRCP